MNGRGEYFDIGGCHIWSRKRSIGAKNRKKHLKTG